MTRALSQYDRNLYSQFPILNLIEKRGVLFFAHAQAQKILKNMFWKNSPQIFRFAAEFCLLCLLLFSTNVYGANGRQILPHTDSAIEEQDESAEPISNSHIYNLVATEELLNEQMQQNESMLEMFKHTTILLIILVVFVITLAIAALWVNRKRGKRHIDTLVSEIEELRQILPPTSSNIATDKSENQSNITINGAVSDKTDISQSVEKGVSALNKICEGDELVDQITKIYNSSSNMNMSISDVASQLGMSAQTLRRRFVAATGQSPKGLIIKLKMQRATDLLLSNPEMTVSQVASLCGFTEASSFIRSFMNVYDMSPTQYRKVNGMENAG